ncbi:MAG: hypothetical protein Q7S58_17515 [Candidatus Binatus sp.]|uniref:hypothetical protein n=1 Tax=Candidatus Binatus sp. TaxID=2811406 RepID=UPI0027249CDC|nr:hypothetical protein [Candidatus Binatus sp.]MDO8434201.1 hypothetical protein [Candidatus Binatus sp.]
MFERANVSLHQGKRFVGGHQIHEQVASEAKAFDERLFECGSGEALDMSETGVRSGTLTYPPLSGGPPLP